MSTAILKPAPPETWAMMGSTLQEGLAFCDGLVRSGLLPKAVDTAQKALVIVLKGRELGIPPMHALTHINVIQGKPTASAELMMALMLRAGCRASWGRTDGTTAELSITRHDGTTHKQAFTIADAKVAGLLGKGGPWVTYPAAMLRARVISSVARAFCPDYIGGLSYTPEELGAEVIVNRDGEVEVVSAAGEAAVSSGTLPNLPPPVKPSPPATDFQRKTLARLLMLKERNVDASCVGDALANYYDMEWDTLSAFDADAVIGLLRTKPDLTPETVVLAEPPPPTDEDLPFPDEPLASAPAASSSAPAVASSTQLVDLITRNAARGKWLQPDGTIRIGKRLSERLEIAEGFYSATDLAERCGSAAPVALLTLTDYQAGKAAKK